MPRDSTQRKLRAALDRLLTGNAIRSDGRLTVTGLAREAGVSRATAHRYPDVLADLATASPRPPVATGGEEQPESALEARNAELSRENASLRAEKEALANAVYALAELLEGRVGAVDARCSSGSR